MVEQSWDAYTNAFPTEFGKYKKENYKDHIQRLEEACEWLGIDKGRAGKYAELIREFYEDDKRTEQHILAYNESAEIADIYRLWLKEVVNFPGLKRKIAAALNSGSVLVENERAERSKNRPRNDFFVYFIAGDCLNAGYPLGLFVGS
jgi:hypothetical protein